MVRGTASQSGASPSHRHKFPRPFIVECQHSRISADEWEQRTRDYDGEGHPVLWVWDSPRLCLGGEDNDAKSFDSALWDGEVDAPEEVRRCHNVGFNRAYGLDWDGHLCALHYYPVKRSDTGYGHRRGPRRLKRRKTVAIYEPDEWEGPEPWRDSKSGIRMINMGEGKAWWKDEEDERRPAAAAAAPRPPSAPLAPPALPAEAPRAPRRPLTPPAPWRHLHHRLPKPLSPRPGPTSSRPGRGGAAPASRSFWPRSLSSP